MITKTAADQLENPFMSPGFKSEKLIVDAYLDKYKGRLLSGDHKPDGWINKQDEKKHIQRLRRYYEAMRDGDGNVVRLSKSESERFEDKLDRAGVRKEKNKGLLKDTGKTMLYAPVVPLALSFGKAIAARAKKKVPISKTFIDVFPFSLGTTMGTIGAVGGVKALSNHSESKKPHTRTPLTTARRRSKMSDEELLKLLRGNVVKTKVTKKIKDYI